MKISEISENISHTSKRLRDIEREKKVKPGTDDWFKLWFSLPYLKEAKENIYDILEPEDCGPFDGGCVLVAQALQQIHGGDIVVLINDRGNADHAAVKIGNTLLDFDGPLPVEKFIKRFEKNEHVKVTGIRPMKDSDLPDATRNQSLLPKIVDLLSNKKSKKVKEAKENITNEDRHPNDRPYGPETKPTMPAGTVRVDVSDVYDWYKLGMHISDLKGLGKHDFGKGPPSTIFSFGSEEQEHDYIKDLEKTGLTTTDIDPKDLNQPKDMPRQKTDPTYNVENVADVKKSVNNSGQSYMLQLERDTRANMLVLHILNKQTGKRTEVRGKLGYETNGYDPEDKLHQLLDKIGKSASVSDLMNGDVVSINPRHPQGPAALKVAHDLTNESNPFTDARMNAIKAGKTEFKVGGKTYKVTGDTRDEKAAVAKEGLAEESGKEMLKIFRGMHHDAGMNKDMDRFILAHDWQLGNFTPDMFPSEEEFFDYDDPFDRVVDIDYGHRVDLSAPIIVGPQFSDGKYSVIDGNHRAAAAQRMGKTIKAYFPVEKTNENFADGKNPGRKGLAKRMGVNTKASVSDLRKTAKNSSGEKQRMAHWLANMKSGRQKASETIVEFDEEDEIYYSKKLAPVAKKLFQTMYPEAKVKAVEDGDGYLSIETTDGVFGFSIGVSHQYGDNVISVGNAYAGSYKGVVGQLVKAAAELLQKKHPDGETTLVAQHDVSDNYWPQLANKLGINYENNAW